MRAQLKIVEADSADSGEVEYDVVRPFRFRAEIAAMRVDALRHLSRQVGRVERLLKESPANSLTIDELLALDAVLSRLRMLTYR
jgi:hypothetical protein